MKPRNPSWLAMIAAMVATGRLFAAEAATAAPITYMPFQTATFISDPAVAEEMNNLAEFSARLLYWMDTPREPVVFGSRVLRAATLPFIEEWRGLSAQPGAAAGLARLRIPEGYRALASPRLLRVVVDEHITFVAPTRTDGMAGHPLEVPCLIENRRSTAISLRLRSSSGPDVLATVKLLPGRLRAVFLSVAPAPAKAALSIVAEGEQEQATVDFPVTWHEAAGLEVTIVDDGDVPTPARVYLTGKDARAYAPAGTMHHIVSAEYGQPFGGDPYFYSTGRFEVTMPAGEATLEVVKGFEYEPVQLKVPVTAGKPANVTVHLKRRKWVKEEGWYSGDSHVHANLFAQKLIKPLDARLVAKAEDINVMNLLPCNDPLTATISDRQYFTGKPDAASDRETILYFSEEMRNDISGHVGFLGLKQFVEPAYFGWPNSPFPYDYPGNTPQCAQAKAQGAAVTYVHPALPSGFPVDIALGAADTIDVMSQNANRDEATSWWYKLLNCGFHCPASAGPDSFLNIPVHLVPGACRVYVNVGREFTYDRWLDGFKRGRSFVTNGPLLRFSVNGAGAGDELSSPGPLLVKIVGSAECNVPMTGVDVVVNGEVVRRIPAGGNPLAIAVSETLTLDRSGWVALRVSGPPHRLVPIDRAVYAHTSPVYVTIAGRKIASREAAEFFIGQIDALIVKMDTRGKFASPAQRDEIAERFRQAQEVYRRIAAASEPLGIP